MKRVGWIKDLPPTFIAYVAGLCLLTATVIGISLPSAFQVLTHPIIALTSVTFVALAFAAEMRHVGLGGVAITVTGAVIVASVLVLPFPLPLLIALVAMVLRYTQPNKFSPGVRVFNSVTTPLTAAASSALATHFGLFENRLHGDAFIVAMPQILFVIAIYFLLEQVKVIMAIRFLLRQSMWNIVVNECMPVISLEISIAVGGVLMASIWQLQPLYTIFFLLPALAVRKALDMLRARSNVESAHRHIAFLKEVATATARVRLRDSQIDDFFLPFLNAAQQISRASDAALYLLSPSSHQLARVATTGATLPETVALPDVRLEHLSRSNTRDVALGLLPGDDDEPRGLLRLSDLAEPLDDEGRDSVQLLGLLIDAALENTARYQRRTQEAMTDALTGLANRAAFDSHLSMEASRALVPGAAPLGLICVDLDRFKEINDTHGHKGGDAALMAVARTLMSTVRGADMACRPGGDEFCVVLPGTGLLDARDVARRMSKALNSLVVMHEGRAIRIGASVGLAVLPDHGVDATGLYAAADAAAYQAKQAGRGCVCDPDGLLDDRPVGE